MKILLLGKNGQVGRELQRALAPLSELVALDRHGSDEHCGDLANPEGLRATIRHVRPAVLVNAAAFTAVDRAEHEQEQAELINARAPQLMAEEMQRLGGWLVHYSTDYVFSGQGNTPWQETDTPAPVNVYGHSKLAGDRAIQASGCRHLILRTGWVYSTHGRNFAKTMLQLAREHEDLNIINDLSGTPTGADLIADVSAHALRSCLANPALGGLYHLAASGDTTWHGYASRVIALARQHGASLKVQRIHPIAASTYQGATLARRPANARLDCRKLQDSFGLHLPHWADGVSRLVETLESNTP